MSRARTSSAPASGDLFDREREDWLRDPAVAFDAWLANQQFRASSAQVYRAQWGLFLEWLQARRKTLATVDRRSIADFVAGLSIRKPQRARYLRLIERVLDHVRSIEAASTNPARFIAQDGEAGWRNARDNEPTGFLSASERTTLIAHLSSPVIGRSGAERWREYRDRALVAIFLGGGLKTGEAIALTMHNINAGTGWLTVDGDNPLLSRRTRLAPFAVAVLGAWLEARAAASLAGPLVFPAASSGKPMHKATALRAIDALIDAAGIAASREARASPQTLRNTFAADLFESGVEAELVGEWLGFAQPVSAHRLHRAWKTWGSEQIADEVDEGESGSHDA
ncbi:tyrosine-type recombinase/integrase [Paraburkholderia edwinii]|uniref:tyrosine-type recombinase/integrase n=1 Tax=Paraburkholderia edwinii TaxID=2861782 RepID=UPI001FE81905|nr:site-specific integrase [Paraburkholderia edwinii]